VLKLKTKLAYVKHNKTDRGQAAPPGPVSPSSHGTRLCSDSAWQGQLARSPEKPCL